MIAHRRGTAGETLLTIVILALLLLSGFELARGFSVKHTLDEGSATAARQLSLNPAVWTTAVATVQTNVTNNVLGGDLGPSISVELFDANGASMAPATLANAPFGTEFRVRASVAMNLVMPLLGTASRTVTVEHRLQ
jgi:Flp pilus assembly protein TadG